MGFSTEELKPIHRQTWWIHRTDPDDGSRIAVTLPSKLMAKILGRKQPISNAHTLTAYSDTGHICCGTKAIWTTGVDHVIRVCKENTSDEDLLLMDYIELIMWHGHRHNLINSGCLEAANHMKEPTIWRDGKEIKGVEKSRMIAQAEETWGKIKVSEL